MDNTPKQKNILILSWNARGLTGDKISELQLLVNKQQPDIVAIQETHFKPNAKPKRLQGYQYPPELISRDEKRGGGLALYLKNGIKYLLLKERKYDGTELQAIKVFGDHTNIEIHNCYLANRENISKNSLQFLEKDSIFIGDFNLHHNLWNPPGYSIQDKLAKELIEILDSKHLMILNNGEVTRLGECLDQNDTAVDLAIIPTKLAYKSSLKVHQSSLGSDHLPLLLNIEFQTTLEPPKTIPKWKTHKADWALFKQLAEQGFNYDTTNLEINKHEALFIEALNKYAEKSIPKTNCKTKKLRKSVPWWNKQCDLAIRKRKNARTKYKFRKTQENLDLYKAARKEAKKVIQQAKKENWEQFASSLDHRTSSKEIWDKVNRIRGKHSSNNPTLMVDDTPIIKDTDKASTLAKHYQAVSSNSNLPDKFVPIKKKTEKVIDLMVENKGKQASDASYNIDFTLLELEQALSKCKNTAPGEDLINYEMIKQLPLNAKNKLLDLFNQSWNNGTSPEGWGKAIIIPLLKIGKDKADPASYRPISLTTCLTKIMQRMIKARLVPFLENNNLLPKTQSGCRTNRSCEDHLLKLEADIRKAQLENRYLLAIFLDLSNAFDRCWNKGVLLNLINIGIKGKMLNWIANFLENRQIAVRVNGQTSETLTTENGCPQGSVLSPILFNVIMNTLSKAIQDFNSKPQNELSKTELAQFVDDGAFWIKSGNLKTLANKGQNLLNLIEKWANNWGFTINPTKTQVIIFRKPTMSVTITQGLKKLELLGKTIEYSKVIKFLGLYFDEILSWKNHIVDLEIRCNKDMNIIRMLSGTDWGASKKSLMILYRSLIQSKLNYGSAAFSSASDRLLKRLQIIQNRALKIITGTINGTNTMSLHAETACLPISLQFEQNALKYWARSGQLQENLPINEYITDIPIFHKPTKRKIKKPYCHTVQEKLNEHHLGDISIQKSVFCSIETIKHKPEPNLHLTKVIDKKKDSVAKLYLETTDFIENNYNDFDKIYTDGSKDPQEKLTGAGLAIFNKENNIIGEKRLKLHEFNSIFTAELAAISKALDYIEENEMPKTVILSDSLSALQAIQNISTTNRPDLIHSILKQVNHIHNKGLIAELAWIPSHIGILGNDQADNAAKQGSINGDPTPIQPNAKEMYAVIKEKIKDKFHKLIKKNPSSNNYLHKHIPMKITQYCSARANDVLYTRMRLGCTKFQFSSKVGKQTNCRSCGIEINLEHIFFDNNEQCPQFTIQRQELHNKLLNLNLNVISVETLLHPPKQDAEKIRTAIFEFLAETRFKEYF